MTDIDPTQFKVTWGDRSDSNFYAIDSGTYLTKVERVDWKQTGENSANPGSPMAQVQFRITNARVTKPARGKKPAETVTESRTLPQYFTFSSGFAIEQAHKFLIAAGVATAEELEEEMEGPEVVKRFSNTEGADLAIRVQKQRHDPEKNPRAIPDDEGNLNRIQGYFGKDTPQYERAASAAGTTFDASKVSFGRKRKSE